MFFLAQQDEWWTTTTTKETTANQTLLVIQNCSICLKFHSWCLTSFEANKLSIVLGLHNSFKQYWLRTPWTFQIVHLIPVLFLIIVTILMFRLGDLCSGCANSRGCSRTSSMVGKAAAADMALQRRNRCFTQPPPPKQDMVYSKHWISSVWKSSAHNPPSLTAFSRCVITLFLFLISPKKDATGQQLLLGSLTVLRAPFEPSAEGAGPRWRLIKHNVPSPRAVIYCRIQLGLRRCWFSTIFFFFFTWIFLTWRPRWHISSGIKPIIELPKV